MLQERASFLLCMKIRCIAICLIRHQGSLFVLEGYDPVKESHFYRPLGGGIDFGETGLQTVAREFQEETGQAICNLRYLDTLENIFTYKGRACHEIVRLYEGDFANPEMYQTPEITAFEDNGQRFKALWVSWQDCLSGKKRLVPEDLIGLIQRHQLF